MSEKIEFETQVEFGEVRVLDRYAKQGYFIWVPLEAQVGQKYRVTLESVGPRVGLPIQMKVASATKYKVGQRIIIDYEGSEEFSVYEIMDIVGDTLFLEPVSMPLPCPYCKNEELRIARDCYNWCQVTCNAIENRGCNARGPRAMSEAEAIRAWNEVASRA